MSFLLFVHINASNETMILYLFAFLKYFNWSNRHKQNSSQWINTRLNKVFSHLKYSNFDCFWYFVQQHWLLNFQTNAYIKIWNFTFRAFVYYLSSSPCSIYASNSSMSFTIPNATLCGSIKIDKNQIILCLSTLNRIHVISLTV